MADSDAAQTPEPLTPSTSTAPVLIHPRREPFEYGLLSIPKLVFSDGLQTLSHVKWTLLLAHINHRVSTETVAWVLQIPVEHSRLLIETLASVLHDDSDPVVKARARKEVDAAGVNVFDLLIFLYIQSYKRLLPKGHKDSATVADVWPSTSAFDGFLSVLSPLQLVRCNSRRLMPSHADEVAHQLSYLQKHLSNIISLLSDVSEGEDETMVLSLEKFEHLGFLVYSGEKRPEKIPLSQNTPFFANSDPDMPAAPILASHVLDWLLQNISYTLERMSDRASSKENSPSNTSDQDVTMADVGVVSTKPSSSLKGPTLIEGVSKASYVKQATDLNNTSVKVVNCHESVIYILAPMKYATVYGCSDATIVLGAVGKAVRVEHCERVHLITATKRICIANCRECLFFLGVNQPPFFVGDNHKLQVAPYNTFYPQLEEHLSQVGIDPNINKWGEPVVLGMVDPHDSLSHPAGVSDVQSESVTRLESDLYTSFVIPNWVGGEQDGCTKDNPFPLSDPYLASQKKKGYVEPEIASNAAVVPSSDEEISDDSTTDLPRLRRREDKKLKKLLGIKKVYDAGERKEKDVQSGERKEKDVQSEGRVSERRVSKSAGHRRWWRRLRYYTSGLAALNGTRRLGD